MVAVVLRVPVTALGLAAPCVVAPSALFAPVVHDLTDARRAPFVDAPVSPPTVRRAPALGSIPAGGFHVFLGTVGVGGFLAHHGS
jgi:hypothetical protein